jgi:hypothetical protein
LVIYDSTVSIIHGDMIVPHVPCEGGDQITSLIYLYLPRSSVFPTFGCSALPFQETDYSLM